jgi:hypothetical protein
VIVVARTAVATINNCPSAEGNPTPSEMSSDPQSRHGVTPFESVFTGINPATAALDTKWQLITWPHVATPTDDNQVWH